MSHPLTDLEKLALCAALAGWAFGCLCCAAGHYLHACARLYRLEGFRFVHHSYSEGEE